MPSATRRPRKIDRRMQMHVSVHVGTFLDLVCKYTGARKSQMIQRIWSAGMKSIFGVTPDHLEIARLSIPPDQMIDPERDLKELTKLICGGGS